MNQQIENRRRFSRVPFRHPATLLIESVERPFSVEILDLSLNGALIHPPGEWHGRLPTDVPCKLRLYLDTAGDQICMEGRLMHHMAGFYGIESKGMDVESMTHLRRLVLLNLGDERLAEREFSQLIQTA